jgi:hypothetical protein
MENADFNTKIKDFVDEIQNKKWIRRRQSSTPPSARGCDIHHRFV